MCYLAIVRCNINTGMDFGVYGWNDSTWNGIWFLDWKWIGFKIPQGTWVRIFMRHMLDRGEAMNAFHELGLRIWVSGGRPSSHFNCRILFHGAPFFVQVTPVKLCYLCSHLPWMRCVKHVVMSTWPLNCVSENDIISRDLPFFSSFLLVQAETWHSNPHGAAYTFPCW